MHLGPLREKDGGVSIRIEANTSATNIVEHDSICPFAKKFLAGTANVTSHLRGKRDHERARSSTLHHAASNVFGRLQFED